MGVYEFDRQLKEGQRGEELFFQSVNGAVEFLDGRTSDLIVASTQKKIELKTDTFDMTKTPNFFMERFSTDTKFEPGGPWQALAKGSDLFIYMFIKQGQVFVFQTQPLVLRLENVCRTQELISVRNRTYNTLGYKVRRELLDAVCLGELNIYKEGKELARLLNSL